MEFIDRFDGIYQQIWWNISTDLMEFINTFDGIYWQISWNLSTDLMEFINRFDGIYRQIWWNLSTDLMEFINRFDGIYRQILWNLSTDLMEYIDRFVGIYRQIWWNISTDLMEFINRFDGIYQQIWWNISTDFMEFIDRFFPVSNFTKIRPKGAALILADRRTDRHGEAHSRFSRILVNNQLDALFHVFISSLYMFRASQCSSSGDRIVLIHHLVWLVCVSDCLGCRSGGNCSSLLTGIPSSHLHILIIPDDVLIQFDLLMMSTVMLETCREA